MAGKAGERDVTKTTGKEEAQMNWNKWMRQTHRWLSVVFTAAVLVNLVMVLMGKYSNTMGLSAVAVLMLMLVTGLYLFVLPYAAKWGKRRQAS